jgi:hypothetical protein
VRTFQRRPPLACPMAGGEIPWYVFELPVSSSAAGSPPCWGSYVPQAAPTSTPTMQSRPLSTRWWTTLWRGRTRSRGGTQSTASAACSTPGCNFTFSVTHKFPPAGEPSPIVQTVLKGSPVKKLPGFGRSARRRRSCFVLKTFPVVKINIGRSYEGSGGFVRKCALLSKQGRLSAIV